MRGNPVSYRLALLHPVRQAHRERRLQSARWCFFLVCGTAGQLHRVARHTRPEHTPVYRGAAPTPRTPRQIPEMVFSYLHSTLDMYAGSPSCCTALPSQDQAQAVTHANLHTTPTTGRRRLRGHMIAPTPRARRNHTRVFVGRGHGAAPVIVTGRRGADLWHNVRGMLWGVHLRLRIETKPVQ